MENIIDEVSKTLAAGISRRAALVGLLARSVTLLPCAGEGKERRKGRRRRQRARKAKYEKYVAVCREWCGYRFAGKQIADCVDKAKQGEGPCYSETERGPGFVCFTELACPDDVVCCTAYALGQLQVSAECCPLPRICAQYGGPAFICSQVS